MADEFKQALESMNSNSLAGITERKLNISVWFVPMAERDDIASKKAGRTIYREKTYMGRRNIGDKDYVTQLATPEHIAEYPQEWALYQAKLRNPQTSIRHLPGIELHPAIRMYCEDAKIGSIEALAEATDVQEELLPAQALARKWVAMMAAPTVEAVTPKKRGGRVKGSKNKPKVPTHVQDTEAAA